MKASRLVRDLTAPDTTERIAQRKFEAECRAQAAAAQQEKFPLITAANAREAIDYFDRRYDELLAARSKA